MTTLDVLARAPTLIQSLANDNTSVDTTDNWMIGWTGPGSTPTRYAPTEGWTWGSSGSGVFTYTPIAGMYGTFMVRAYVHIMDRCDLRYIIKDAQGNEVWNALIDNYRGGGRTVDRRILVNIPVGGKVEVHWYMKSGYKKKGRFYIYVLSDNREEVLEYYLVSASLDTPRIQNNIALGYDPRTDSGGYIKDGWEHIPYFITDHFVPICMYGTFLFFVNGVQMDGMYMKIKVFDMDGVLVFEEVLRDYFSTNHNFTIAKVVDVPLGGNVMLEWRADISARYNGYWNYTFYVNDRKRPPPIPVQPEEPEIVIEEKTLSVNVAHDGVIVSSASQVFEYETTNSNTVTITNELLQGATHICLWDYFLKVMGRRPQDGEAITFIIPEDVMLVAPYFNRTKGVKPAGVTLLFNQWDSSEVIHQGCGAIDTVGWDAELRNFIKLDIRGKVIGSFPPKIDSLSSPTWVPEYPYITLDSWMAKTSSLVLLDDATGEKLSYEYLRSKGFSNPYPYYNSLITTLLQGIGYYAIDGVKQPAINAHVSLDVVVRSGGYVLGGGGYRTTGEFFNKEDLFKPQGGSGEGSLIDILRNDPRDLNGCDDIWNNGNGGDAIWVNGRGIVVQVENYGYISGGGGGGESLGADSSHYIDIETAYETFTPAVAAGGGAPFGGFDKPYIPLYVNLEELRKFSIETIDVRDNNFRGTSLVVRPIPASSNIKDQTGVSCPIEESQKVVGVFNTPTSQFNYSTFTTYAATRTTDLRKVFNLTNFKYRKRRADQADWISPTIHEIDVLKASWDERGLQASLGREQQNTTAHYRSGSGGSPGVDGQAGTILSGGNAITGSMYNLPVYTLAQRRVGAGVKGLPVRYINGASEAMNFTLVEHPGSIFNR